MGGLLETAWFSFVSSKGVSISERVLQTAARHILYRQMVIATENRHVIPGHDDLVISVTRSLCGGEYRSIAEVQWAVIGELSSNGANSGVAKWEQRAMLVSAA